MTDIRERGLKFFNAGGDLIGFQHGDAAQSCVKRLFLQRFGDNVRIDGFPFSHPHRWR
jgi:hypothetical protein